MSDEKVWVKERWSTKPREITVAKRTDKYVWESRGVSYRGKERFVRHEPADVFPTLAACLDSLIEDQRKAVEHAEREVARALEVLRITEAKRAGVAS